jgi:hypothetical protein
MRLDGQLFVNMIESFATRSKEHGSYDAAREGSSHG